MSQALYRKWRPRLWEQVVSQEPIIQTLQNAVRSERVAHAYLFSGPRGTGKTTTARLLAKAVNCLDPDPANRPCDHCEHCQAVNEGRFLDLIEIDAASNTSVDDVRDLRDKINFSPSQGRYKVYIIDEVHMLSTAAFNALLKTLEEPPAHAIFVLATTEVHKIPGTVLSRCQRHEFRRVPVKDIVDHLQQIAEKESLQVEPEALTLIARQATGALRDAISMLDQLSSSGEKITLETAQQVLGTATSRAVVDLVNAILARQAAEGLNGIHQALDGGTDPRQFARQVVEYLRGLLLIRLGNADQIDATPEVRAEMERQAKAFSLSRLMHAIRQFNNAASEIRSGWQPSLLLELALTETIVAEPPASGVLPDSNPSRPEAPTATTGKVQAVPPAAAPAQKSASLPSSAPASPPAADQTPPPAKTERPPENSASNLSPAQPQSQPAEEAASSTTVNISLQEIRQNWRRIRTLVKEKNPPTEALLNSCKMLTIKDNALLMGFSSLLLKSKMESKENLEVTRQVIEQVLSIQVPIVCVVIDQKGTTATPDLDFDGDGMVNAAINLGGQIAQKE